MFFKSTIPKDLYLLRKEKGIDHLDSSFKLFLLESSMYVKGAKARNTLDGMINYFLDTKGQIPKDPKASNGHQGSMIHKLGDGVVSSGYILMQINCIRNKLNKDGRLSHNDFSGIPNYEGFRDKIKDLFKLEIFKKREEERLRKEAEEIEIEKIEKRRVQEILEKMGNTQDYRQNFFLRLTNDMHYLEGVRNIEDFVKYLIDNQVLIPGDSLDQNNFDSRKLVMLVHSLRNKVNLVDSDFNVLPSYDGFREKVKKLLNFRA